MHKNSLFNFDYTYLSLPDKFYSFVKPQEFPRPELFLFNQTFANSLNLNYESQEDLINLISNQAYNGLEKCFGQAYAGHQFGNFTKLGDGRAIIIGEHLTLEGKRYDIQLKGSGKTPYSRGGDGKATLKAMLREYLISEAMSCLNIPSSRSLAVIKTGDLVQRETIQEGAALYRVMKSHIRVGTFEYAAYFGSKNDLLSIVEYTVNRLYPELSEHDNKALSLLRSVMENQIDLVSHWMRVGFIHGVMCTDNTAISGESFDYGPCAFMNAYHPATVYSSIDQYGRYSFGNQPNIIKWNITRFAEALLPVIHENKDKSIELAQRTIDEFDAIWEKKYYQTMLSKIGLEVNDNRSRVLVDELLLLMQRYELDYTNTYNELYQKLLLNLNPENTTELKSWFKKWVDIIEESASRERALKLMNEVNPIIIPRNHIVEKALNEAVCGNMFHFQKLLSIISKPYQQQEGLEDFSNPPDSDFENQYQTYCGT